MKGTCAVLLSVAILLGTAVAQDRPNEQKTLSVWNIHTRDVIILQSEQSTPIAFLTPVTGIVIRRIEALSMRGPVFTSVASPEPIPCPLPFSLEISNGSIGKIVPVSTTFIKKGSEQTYTDSGLLDLRYRADDRIILSMVVPAPGFPPKSCALNGMNISIQFEPASAAKIH